MVVEHTPLHPTALAQIAHPHHTIGGANLTGPNFLGRKEHIVAALRSQIEHGDLDRMARIRASKTTL